MDAAVIGEREPLALNCEVTTAGGTQHRWGSDEHPEDRPQDITFSTKRGEGFDRGGLTLPRRTDQEFHDLGLKNDVVLAGASGSVAYEGRIAATPRSGLHQIEVQCHGWMSYARQRKLSEIIVDRDLSVWGPPSRARQIVLAATYGLRQHEVAPDDAGNPSLRASIIGAWNTRPLVEAWYDAGPGNKLGYLWISFTSNGIPGGGDANWKALAYKSVGDNGAFTSILPNSGNFWVAPAPPNPGYTNAINERYAMIEWLYDATGAAGSEGTDYGTYWKLAAYGDHGLTRRGADPGGFYASDVIKHIASKYCPKLSTAGVRDTSFPITHLPFRDRIFPYDAWLQINKHHLWALAVWEQRTLTYEPFDLTDYDWQVRVGEHGVTTTLQGDSVQQLANGIAVTYFDVEKGAQNVLTPDTHAELRDESVEHPSNLWGEEDWTELNLSFPATEDTALEVGRAALAEFNAPKHPGTITIPRYVQDRAGNWEPVWKVRSDQTIAIVNHPNDRPRLIHETTYNHQRKELVAAVEGPMPRLDAYYDRINTALAAQNVRSV